MRDTNVYQHKFTCGCPVNGAQILYKLRIETPVMVPVEDIVAACRIEASFHEPIADDLFRKFGGRQTLRASHHGVRITTYRGFE